MWKCIDAVFDDKRVCVSLLMGWLACVMAIFKEIGLLDTKFIRFGPSTTAVFMGAVLDTWYKWMLVAVFTFVNTSINDFVSDAINPWLLNTITDHKTKYIPYPKWVCLCVAQTWAVYCNIMGVFGLFLSMTQADFVLIRLSADLFVNMYTNYKFMRGKVHCRERYGVQLEESHHHHHHLQPVSSPSTTTSGKKKRPTTSTAPSSSTSAAAAMLCIREDQPETTEMFCINSVYEDEDEVSEGTGKNRV